MLTMAKTRHQQHKILHNNRWAASIRSPLCVCNTCSAILSTSVNMPQFQGDLMAGDADFIF